MSGGLKRRLAIFAAAAVVVFFGSALRPAQAQTYLLSPGGNLGGANSTPSSSNYNSVYQEGGDTTDYVIPSTLANINNNGNGDDTLGAGVYTSTANIGGQGSAPTLGFYYAGGGGNSAPTTYATTVYNTNTPSGSGANPLNLGSTSSTVNTFAGPTSPSSPTLTLTADFLNNNYGNDIIGFIVPKDTDAGASVTAPTATGDYVGIELALSTGSSSSTFKLFGQTNFAGTGTVALGSSPSTGTITSPPTKAYRLILSVANTSSTHDQFTATVYNLSAGNIVGSPVTITYSTTNGTASGNFHVNTSALGVEIGEGPITTGAEQDAGNVTLSAPEPTACGIMLISAAAMALRRKKRQAA